MNLYKNISTIGQKTIRSFILVHFLLLIVVGFIFYDNVDIFYTGLQLSFISIYLVSIANPDAKSKILLQGLFEMTFFETLDYVTGANKYIPDDMVNIHKKLIVDAIIIIVFMARTYKRYYNYGKGKRDI